jgi:cell division protease FtsH
MQGYDLARKILSDNMDTLKSLAENLLELESLDGEQIEAIIRGEPISRPIAPVAATPEVHLFSDPEPEAGGA